MERSCGISFLKRISFQIFGCFFEVVQILARTSRNMAAIENNDVAGIQRRVGTSHTCDEPKPDEKK
jgi:hypothetical protein